MKKSVYILGLNGSHGASAALLKDGELLACVQEERFTRQKNQVGYPHQSIAFCLKQADITANDLNSVNVGFQNPTLFLSDKTFAKNTGNAFLSILKPVIKKPFDYLGGKHPLFHNLYELRKKTPVWRILERQQITFLAQQLRISLDKIHLLDHHTTHAFAAYYTNPDYAKRKSKKTLVLTLDGEGDSVCSKIFIVENDTWTEIASTPDGHSLGWLYEYVTEYLGMKRNEDESKVMGLAPYADKTASEKVYQKLRKLLWVKGLQLHSRIPRVSYPQYLRSNLRYHRFDAIAGGIQMLTEKLVVELVTNAMQQTGVTDIVLGGGVFMNVKVNMLLAKLPKVTSLFVMPSCTDDSTAIGATYYGYQHLCLERKLPFSPKPPTNLSLGPSFSNTDIKKAIQKIRISQKMTVQTLIKPEKAIAQLLSDGHVVAYLQERMEYGARALGNRSILADPRNPDIVYTINAQIKKRDFWMPFAPTILKKRANDYLLNPKQIDSPYMMIAFETTEKGQRDLKAAMHPYDHTVRAQILTREQNLAYYDLIKSFEEKTGVGALLNTSFNLHGEPIVCTPEDALSTFIRSGLQYLVLENFLITKTSGTTPNS